MSRSRATAVALAVVLSVLVVTAQPALAAETTQLVTGSSHSTASEFEAGTLGDGMYINGSGDDAVIEIDGGNATETFSYTGSEQTFEVPDGVDEVEVELFGAGSETNQNGGYVNGTLSVTAGETLRVYVGGTGSSGNGGFNGGGDSDTGNAGGGATDIRQGGSALGDRVAVAGGAGASGSSSGDNGGGGRGGPDTGQSGGDAEDVFAFADGGKGGSQSSGGGGGSPGGQSGSLGQGGTGHEAGGGGGGGYYGGGGGGYDSESEGGDFYDAAGGGGGGSNYDDGLSNVGANERGTGNSNHGQAVISYSIAEDSSTYLSQNHTVEDSVGGEVNITEIENGTVTVTFEGWDGSSWSTLNETTGIASTGVHSFTWSEFSTSSTIRTNVTVLNGSGSGGVQFRMASESVQFNARSPTVDNSSASPTGTIFTAEPTLSIDVNDSDFPLDQGDEVTVEFHTNKSGQVGTDTLTANGTASATIDAAGGSTKWWVETTDSYGLEQRSENKTYTAPGELRIYNETAVRLNDSLTDAELVDEVEVEIRMYQDDGTLTLVTRTTNNGVINMEGLDPDQPFVVVAQADNYTDRRIFVPSLFETQEVFLLPEDQPTATPTFELRDFSGLYPQEETVLEIDRGLNGSWRTVAGDFFGATGEFTATLKLDGRHRLVVRNVETGQTDVVGIFTPTSDEDKIVRVTDEGDVDLIDAEPDILFDPSVSSVPAEETTISVEFRDTSDPFSSYDATAIFRNDSGNTTLAQASGSLEDGETLELTVNLSDRGVGNLTVVANWSTTTSSGTVSQTYIIRETFTNPHSLLAVLGKIPSRVPASTQGVFFAGLSIFITILGMTAAASTVRLSSEETGLVGVTILIVTATLGWLGWEIVFAASIAWVAFAARARGF